MMRSVLAIVALAIVLWGCGSEDEKRPPSPPPEPEAAFVTESLPEGATVSLRQANIDDRSLVLEIVQQGAGSLYGAAFRLQMDPEVLAYATLTPGPVWSNPISHAASSTPGLMIGVISQRGDQPGIDGVVLGTVVLERRAERGSPVRFVPEKSRLFDEDIEPLSDVTFVGGELVVP
jgi:hypothetical protein